MTTCSQVRYAMGRSKQILEVGHRGRLHRDRQEQIRCRPNLETVEFWRGHADDCERRPEIAIVRPITPGSSPKRRFQ